MSCLQASICLNVSNANSRSLSLPRSLSTLRASASYSSIGVLRSRSERLGLVHSPRRSLPMCLFGGKWNSKDDSDSSPWKSLEKAMGSFGKDKSLEDVLRKQMSEQEFDGGGGLGNPPGSGGAGDGSGESEDAGFFGVIVEIIQVILAILGVICSYLYLFNGPEWTRLVKDYIAMKFGAKRTNRLASARVDWIIWKFQMRDLSPRLLLSKLWKKKVPDKYWLERELLRRRCVGGKLRKLFKSRMRRRL